MLLCCVYFCFTDATHPQVTEMMNSMQLTEVTEDNVLKLKIPFSWMNGKTIYVRDVYKCLHQVTSKAPRDVIVIGNPGIGKSYFAVYKLYLAVRSSKNVVYHRQNTTWCFKPKEGCAFLYQNELSNNSVKTELLHDPSTLFLYDCATREPVKDQGSREARLVVVTSPDHLNYKEIEKRPQTRSYCMPVWSRDELVLCYKNAYDEHQQKMCSEWEEKYRMFGGIPRYIFSDPEQAKTQKVNLHLACASCTPNALMQRVTNHFYADGSHMLFKLEVPTDDPTLPNVKLDFASEYVENRVYEAMKKGKREMRLSFLITALNTTLFAGISGRIFEEEAHKILRKGGWFNFKNLKTKKETQVNLSETKLRTFHNLSEVYLTKSENYWQPLAKNFPAVDALTGPDVMSLDKVKPTAFRMSQVNAIGYQITIAKRHGIKESGLARLHRECGITKLRLVFVVPKVIFASFGEQSLEGSSTPLTVELEQYALCVDIEDYVNKY